MPRNHIFKGRFHKSKLKAFNQQQNYYDALGQGVSSWGIDSRLSRAASQDKKLSWKRLIQDIVRMAGVTLKEINAQIAGNLLSKCKQRRDRE